MKIDHKFSKGYNLGGGNINRSQGNDAYPGITFVSSSLGFLIWRARDSSKNDFVLVQDNVSGGVGAGAFTSRYTTKEITNNFESITKRFGSNTL